MSVILKSGASSDTATVDPTSKALHVTEYDAAGNILAAPAGTATLSTQGGLLTGVQDDGVAYPLRGGKAGSLGTTLGQLLFWEDFESNIVNMTRWVGALSTMTVSQTPQVGLTLNNGASTGLAAVAVVNSARRFDRRMNQPLDVSIRAKVSQVSNSVSELGLGDTTSGTTAIVANGAFFRLASMSMTPVISYNNTEITGSPVNLSAYTNSFLDYGIAVDDFAVVFVVRDTTTGALVNRQRIPFPNTQAKAWAATRLPLMFRCFNSAVPASAPILVVSTVTVIRLDDPTAVPASHAAAGIALGGESVPTTGVQNANFGNSAAPSSATLSNTAAGYTTLGGLFQFVAVAGAETDYCLFGYTVPSPFNLVVTGVHIATFNMGAASATTPTLLQWGIAVGSTAVSLATTTTVPSAHEPLRVALGSQSIPVGTAIGGNVPDIDVPFDTPLFCPAGRFTQVILRMPVGTATASQIIRGAVTVRGYFV